LHEVPFEPDPLAQVEGVGEFVSLQDLFAGPLEELPQGLVAEGGGGELDRLGVGDPRVEHEGEDVAEAGEFVILDERAEDGDLEEQGIDALAESPPVAVEELEADDEEDGSQESLQALNW